MCIIVEARKKLAPLGIQRRGVLLVLGVKLGEVAGVGALQERRAGKYVVHFMSCHSITCRSWGNRREGQKRRALGGPPQLPCNTRARVVPRAAGEFATTTPSSRIASIFCFPSPFRPQLTTPAW